MSSGLKQLNMINSSRSKLQTIINESNKNVHPNLLDKYRIIKLMSSGDYQCNDQFGNTYLLVCQLEQGGLHEFKIAINSNFQRNSYNRALIIPFQDIKHDGVTFTVYMLPQRSVCLKEAISNKVKSQIFCLSLLYTLVKKVLRPLIEVFNCNADQWLHAENIWVKESTIFYVLNQRKKQSNSIKRTQTKYHSVDLQKNNQQRQQYQKQLLRKLCIILTPFFKQDLQIKSFLSVIIDAILNQEFTIQEVCLLLSDKRKRKQFMNEKTQIFVSLQERNENGELNLNKNNQFWGRKRSYYIDNNNRRGLKNSTINIELSQKEQSQQFYAKVIKNAGQTIHIPPSFKSKKRSSLSITGLFSFKDKSKSKRNSLSLQKSSNRYSDKNRGVSQDTQQVMKRTLNSFLRQPNNGYSVDIDAREKAYRRFRETIQVNGQQDQKTKRTSIHEEQKHLKAYLQYKSKQKNRKFSTIDVSQLKNYTGVSNKKISQTIDHEIDGQRNQIRKNLFVNGSQNNLQKKDGDLNEKKTKIRFSTEEGNEQNRSQKEKQKQKQIELQKQLERLKSVEEQRRKQIERLKQKERERQRSREKERERIKEKQRNLEIQIQKQRQRQRQKIRQQQEKNRLIQKQREKLKQLQREKEKEKQRQKVKQKEREKEKERKAEKEMQQKKQKQGQLKRNQSVLEVKTNLYNKNSYQPNLDQIQIIEPIKKSELDAKKQKEQQQKQRQQNKPPLPSNVNKNSNGLIRKSTNEDQIQQIVLNNKPVKQTQKKQVKKEPEPIKKTQIKQQIKRQTSPPPKQEESGSRTKTVTSQIPSSCGPKKSVSKQVAEYMHMINKMGEAVAKSSKISVKLQGIQWFTGVYFIYKRFLKERKSIEKWLQKRQPKLTRYKQNNKNEWQEWFNSEQKKTLEQKIKLQNQNILISILKMNKKFMKKNVNSTFIHHASLSQNSLQDSKIAVSQVVKQFDDLEEKQKLNDQEILTHINELLNSLYVISQLDGRIQQKKPLAQILKIRNTEELSDFSDFIYDLYIKQ